MPALLALLKLRELFLKELNMGENKYQSTNNPLQPPSLQLIRGARKTSRFSRSVVGMNHAVKCNVLKIMLESEFDITSLLQVARLAGIKGANGEPQRKVREILREAFYEKGGSQPPSGPAPCIPSAWPGRRAA
jgi:hypothetical protein